MLTEIFFGKIICIILFHSSKKVFLHNFRQFLENWIFEGISTGADLTKMVNICTTNCAKKLFFGKIICSTHQRKNFRQFLENWIFKGISTGADLTKMVKICIILICAKKIFFAKLFVPLIKRSVSPQCYAIFGKLNFWRNIDRRGPYKNGENLYYLNLC